jgi:hypothetical protein
MAFYRICLGQGSSTGGQRDEFGPLMILFCPKFSEPEIHFSLLDFKDCKNTRKSTPSDFNLEIGFTVFPYLIERCDYIQM